MSPRNRAAAPLRPGEAKEAAQDRRKMRSTHYLREARPGARGSTNGL